MHGQPHIRFAGILFLSVEYFPEVCRKFSKHVEGLPYVCTLLCPIIVNLFKYMYINGHLYEVINLHIEIRFPEIRAECYICLSHEAHLLVVVPSIWSV